MSSFTPDELRELRALAARRNRLQPAEVLRILAAAEEAVAAGRRVVVAGQTADLAATAVQLYDERERLRRELMGAFLAAGDDGPEVRARVEALFAAAYGVVEDPVIPLGKPITDGPIP